MRELKIDDEFRNLIPKLLPEEYQQLQVNILRDGCRDPITTWEGTIVDGHNRYEICQANDVEFDTFPMSFPSRDDAKAWIIRNQFGRRNIPAAVRAALALKLEPLLKEKALEKKSEGGKAGGETAGRGRPKSEFDRDEKNSSQACRCPQVRDEIAKEAGVSHDTIRKVKAVVESPDKQLSQDMLEGRVSVNKAYQTIKGPPAKEAPFNPRPVEKRFLEIRSSVVEMACACELRDSQETQAMIAAVEKVEKAFAKFSRRCAAAWKTLSGASGGSGDVEQ